MSGKETLRVLGVISSFVGAILVIGGFLLHRSLDEQDHRVEEVKIRYGYQTIFYAANLADPYVLRMPDGPTKDEFYGYALDSFKLGYFDEFFINIEGKLIWFVKNEAKLRSESQSWESSMCLDETPEIEESTPLNVIRQMRYWMNEVERHERHIDGFGKPLIDLNECERELARLISEAKTLLATDVQ